MKQTDKELKRKQALVAAEDEAKAAKKIYDAVYKDSWRKMDIWLRAQKKVNRLREHAIKRDTYYVHPARKR